MFDFSEDEWVFMIGACIGALVGAWRWYVALVRVSPLNADGKSRLVLMLTPPASLLLLTLVLQTLADPVYVAGHFDYSLLFVAGGALWMFAAIGAFPLMGISAREDAMRGHNPSAAIAVAGGMVGVMSAYAGSNVGNGPTIWTTLIPALVATGVLLALWLTVELAGGAFEAITLDRDVAAGIRLAAFLVSAGAILGRAMAGDWSNWRSTFTEFAALAWPAALLVPAMTTMNRRYRPTPRKPVPEPGRRGVAPAVIMLALTAVYLAYLGMPEVAPAGGSALERP